MRKRPRVSVTFSHQEQIERIRKKIQTAAPARINQVRIPKSSFEMPRRIAASHFRRNADKKNDDPNSVNFGEAAYGEIRSTVYRGAANLLERKNKQQLSKPPLGSMPSKEQMDSQILKRPTAEWASQYQGRIKTRSTNRSAAMASRGIQSNLAAHARSSHAVGRYPGLSSAARSSYQPRIKTISSRTLILPRIARVKAKSVIIPVWAKKNLLERSRAFQGVYRKPGRIQTQVVRSQTRSSWKPAILSKSSTTKPNTGYVSRIQTGRYIQSLSMPRNDSFKSFHRNNARLNTQVTHDSGSESLKAVRVGYRKGVNTIRTLQNTQIAAKKSLRAYRNIKTRVRTVVRYSRRNALTLHRRRLAVRAFYAVTSTIRRAAMAVKAIVLSPKALLIGGICAAVIFLMIVFNAVVSSMFSMINGAFGWLYRPDKQPEIVFNDYVYYIEDNIDLLNDRIDLVLSSPGQADRTYSFHLGFSPRLLYIDAEYSTIQGGHLSHVPMDDLSALAIIVRDRAGKDEYTVGDFERALIQVFQNYFSYDEEYYTYYHSDHGVDEEGNPIPCDGHAAIRIYATSYRTNDVINRLNLSDHEYALYTEYRRILAEFMMPEHEDSILVQSPNQYGLLFPTPYLSSISSHYGYREDPFTGETAFHAGIDIVGDPNKGEETFQSPVIASFDGKIALIGYSPTNGHYIVLDGYVGDVNYTATYKHLDLIKAREGQDVRAGDVIAFVGNTGRSTGPHLHFELRINSRLVDPWDYIRHN